MVALTDGACLDGSFRRRSSRRRRGVSCRPHHRARRRPRAELARPSSARVPTVAAASTASATKSRHCSWPVLLPPRSRAALAAPARAPSRSSRSAGARRAPTAVAWSSSRPRSECWRSCPPRARGNGATPCSRCGDRRRRSRSHSSASTLRFGGSSHVTRAVGSGPDSLARRSRASPAPVVGGRDRPLVHGIVFLVLLAALVLMGTIRPRRATVDALLVGLAVSLLVNDTPVDVIGLGALGCWALLRWESVDSRPMRRGALIAAAATAAVLALTGCGSQGVTRPLPITVVGTVKAVAPGNGIFVSQGCGACHTYKPAGPAANGKIGPDLDKLAQYAKQAHQPLASSSTTRSSIRTSTSRRAIRRASCRSPTRACRRRTSRPSSTS